MYQRIEQLRLGGRLQVRWQVGELPPRAVVPSLLLQPLLENAINHGIEPLPDGGTVTIEGRVDGGDVTIDVVNPVSPVARAVRSGNRMALDNIRQRLDLVFPGRAAVEVIESGEDYRVRLRFPLVLGGAEPRRREVTGRAGAAENAAQPMPADPPSPEPMRALIVDDEPPARERLRSLIDELDDVAVAGEAANGREALEMCVRLEPDVVLLDIRMPGMDGIEAARHLNALDDPPAVIFTTAHDEHALEAFETQAIGYLLKPVRLEKLARAIRHAARVAGPQLMRIAEQSQLGQSPVADLRTARSSCASSPSRTCSTSRQARSTSPCGIAAAPTSSTSR